MQAELILLGNIDYGIGSDEYLKELEVRMIDREIIAPNVTSSFSTYQAVKKIIGSRINVQECLVVMYLNRNLSVIGYQIHSIGSSKHTTIDNALITSVALKVLAREVIIAHNHPSGNPNPSHMDEKTTRSLQDALQVFDIGLLDHLVITNSNDYYSFADEGILSGIDSDKEQYISHIFNLLDTGERQNKRSIDKIAHSYGITDPTQIKELTELAIVQKVRDIAHSKQPLLTRYDQIVDLYGNQVNLSHRTSQSIMLQQYSTPAPIAFLASEYVKQDQAPTARYFEPSAGNGLLTVALLPQQVVVNEIDRLRYENLCRQPFANMLRQDATEPFSQYAKYFDGIVTNPPFGSLSGTVKYGDFPIKNLDHLMALRALDTMKDSGRAAIIIGGHTTWDSEGRIQRGKNRIFLSYLYKHYNVEDVILVNGDLYSRQGTSFDVRLILINGRKSIPEGYAPLKDYLDTVVNDFDTLFQRVRLTDKTMNQRIKNAQKEATMKLQRLQQLGELGGPYNPASEPPLKPLDTVVPDSMDYEIHSALLEVKQEVGGSINAYVRSHLGYANDIQMAEALSAEQVDAVAMAIYNIEEKGQGMIIGDQTGIGKGRVAAAVIRYACKAGLKPIFITEKANLFSDMYRDLKAIGSADLHPFIVNANDAKAKVKDEEGNVVYEPLERSAQDYIFERKVLGSEFDYVMMTYSQIASEKPTLKQGFVSSIAADNVLILDESHNAGGNLSTSATARFFYNVVKTAKGCIFLSATFAKRPDNMPVYASKTCMSDASLSNEGLVDAISNGGVALQEVLAANLVAEGQMMRRERSFEGIEVNYITLDRTGAADHGVNDKEQEHKAIVDNITSVLRDIIHFQSTFIMPQVEVMDKGKKMEMTEVEVRKGTKELGVSATPYFSKVFNVINQMLFSVKADEVAQRAIQRLQEGKAPIIAFSSTMGAFLENMESERGLPVGDGDVINADFAEVLRKGLDGILRYTEIDETGNSVHKEMSLSELDDEARSEYVRISDVIDSIATGISISPIDRIKFRIEQAGYRVAEVTGRKLEVQFNSLESNIGMVASRKKELVNDAFRKFNNNEVDVLLINQSGSTGASAHAIVTPNVPLSQVRQRVMIVLQAELDINREVQKRGRINRTGQVFKPIYDYVNSAIPAENRMAMMLQKKLKSLDANTTSNQRNSEALLQNADFLNKYGDKLVLDYLAENPDINEELGDPLGLNDPESDIDTTNAASKVSGRVAVLPTIDQQRFYDDMVERYQNYVGYLLQTGDYDLEVETMDLQAKTIERVIKIAGKGGCKSFGGHTYLEKCEVNILKKPFRKQELDNILSESLSGRTAQDIQQEQLNTLEEHIAIRKRKEQDTIEARSEKALANLHKEKGYKKAETPQEQRMYIEDRKRQIADAKATSITDAYKKVDNQASHVRKFLQFFSIGRVLYYPNLDYGIGSQVKTPAVFLGFKISYSKPNPFAPSAIIARVAVANSSKYFEFVLSGDQSAVLERIIAASYQLSAHESQHILNDWDNLIQQAMASRGVRYIYTGNLLQAYGNINEKCKLISYTTKSGENKKGILMPESWKGADRMVSSSTTIVPLVTTLPVIENLSPDQRIKTDNGITILRTSYGYSVMTSSLSVQKFDFIVKNPDILPYIENAGGFQKVGSVWKGDVSIDDIEPVVEAIYRASNCTVSLDARQMEQIGDEFEVEQIQDKIFPKLVELEVKLFTMLKEYGEGMAGLGHAAMIAPLTILSQYYPFPHISSERDKLLSDMVDEVHRKTRNFTDHDSISNQKVEVRSLLEQENIPPSAWAARKQSFSRSEEDVVKWLSNAVIERFGSGKDEVTTTDKAKRIRIARVKAQAKIKLLNLLN